MGHKRAAKVKRRQERKRRKQVKAERAREFREKALEMTLERALEGTEVIRVGGQRIRYSPELLAALAPTLALKQ